MHWCSSTNGSREGKEKKGRKNVKALSFSWWRQQMRERLLCRESQPCHSARLIIFWCHRIELFSSLTTTHNGIQREKDFSDKASCFVENFLPFFVLFISRCACEAFVSACALYHYLTTSNLISCLKWTGNSLLPSLYDDIKLILDRTKFSQMPISERTNVQPLIYVQSTVAYQLLTVFQHGYF